MKELNLMIMNEPMIDYSNQHIYEYVMYPIKYDGHEFSND